MVAVGGRSTCVLCLGGGFVAGVAIVAIVLWFFGVAGVAGVAIVLWLFVWAVLFVF